MNKSEYEECLNILDEIYFSFTRNENQIKKQPKDVNELKVAVFQRLLQIMVLIDPSFLFQHTTYNFSTPSISLNGRTIFKSYFETVRQSLQRVFLAGKMSSDCSKWIFEHWELIFLYKK